ncbi:glycosyltransferase N-terminal domain-containing protein [Kozakia baliensis]|uniref:glycosyltransferase N-terminal domain-containing protein n=1 Tax=Kozakia baliensis TaxID=153496 RepID=UPI00089DCF6E|nr:glycosyltransferase N-terminal domain-containing protein [Kozakia baliensis]GBR29207.1 3-deoxy-D-manno-octulosonic-acid transferase [Kozakia baliensis NRIC 0488]
MNTPPPDGHAAWPSVMARAYLGFTLRTTKWTVTGDRRAVPVLTQAEPLETKGAIVAFWHRSLLLLPALWTWAQQRQTGLRLRVMISRNRDGRLINDAVAPWGIIGIEGSSAKKGKDKGGARALHEACAALRDGSILAITPDGPRGPVGVVQPGALGLTRLAKRPLIPIGAACTALHLPSWDRMMVPLPFGRGELVYGAPLDAHTSTNHLTQALNQTSAEAARRYKLSRVTFTDRVWHLVGILLTPVLPIILQKRLEQGREIEGRISERYGRTTLDRPYGDLLWLHAASVGECRSVLPLIDALREIHPKLNFLVTTATVTGAEIIATYRTSLPSAQAAQLRHQFIPYDVARWNQRFLRHWQPNALVLIDSELWPGLTGACFRQAIPVGVVNGRLSARSWRRWKRLPASLRMLFARLDFVAARGHRDAEHFSELGVSEVHEYGDLKEIAPPPAADPQEVEYLRQQIGNRPIFLAASTHPGEEEIVARAAALAREAIPDLLMIVAPRHPARSDAVAEILHHPPRRSKDETPQAEDLFWLADTLGEMGLFYRLAQGAFIGNSMNAPGGGHNPFEPVRLKTPIVTGPRTDNFSPAFESLGDTVAIVKDDRDLADWMIGTFQHNDKAQQQAETACKRISKNEAVPASLLTRISDMLL